MVIEHGKDTTFKILWEQWHTNGKCNTIQHNRDGEKNQTAIGPFLWLAISASFLTNFDQITVDEKVC